MVGTQLIRRCALCFIWLPMALLAQSDRIAGEVDASRVLKVTGNINPQVKPELDEGPVDPAMKLNYVQLMLKSSAAQQADLNQLLREQQRPGSPNFRKWLSPEQFADRFGVSRADIGKITSWMRAQRLDIITVGRGRRYIAFNATAQQIQSAFKTELRHYRVNGELHFANAAEPSVPEAIQPLVQGFIGLDDFLPKAQSKPIASKPLSKEMSRGKGPAPRYTDSNGNYDITPGDLAIIYDVLPIYQAGYTGAGLYLAVMGQSQIQLSDIATFQSLFDLPPNAPQPMLIPGGTDPGLVSGDEGESDLDIEYAGGIAYGAQILFVYAKNVINSLTWSIDQAVAPVISFSYASCEPNATSAVATSIQSTAQQGSAEGVTWIASSGDDGAAMCDTTAATHGAAVSIEAAIPEVTGVGGTMFNGNSSFYWSNQNNGNDSSALGYVPETTWNESTGSELSASGGGYSTFFTRADWQVGPGIPAGTARGVPDVSLTAAHNDDPYAVIESGKTVFVGGTSAAAPAFAGMILLLNEYLGTNGLGNINPSLYWMAQTTTNVFHDITSGGNFVPCTAGTPNCGPNLNFGYGAHAGWDAATGLGSVDATNMLNDWSAGAATPQIGSVVNGASLTNTGLSPGQIFTIFGSALGPPNGLTLELDENGNVATYLANITVTVDNVAAPLLYVGPGQINAVAPYEIANSVGRNVVVQVNDGSQSSNSFSVGVVATAPAIFSLGNGQGAILNEDGSVNGPGNPAAPGSIIQIFGTGEGQTNPAGVDGQFANEPLAGLPRPASQFSVTIGSLPATYSYAGTAPQSFAGFFQVDAQIPNNVRGGNQPVILKVGGASSAPLNVAVK
jgi:uncharacterized protein (TIGR03437 family)